MVNIGNVGETLQSLLSETHCCPPLKSTKPPSEENPRAETESQFTEDISSSHKHITLLHHQPGLKEVCLPHSTVIMHLINSNFVSFFEFIGSLRKVFHGPGLWKELSGDLENDAIFLQ